MFILSHVCAEFHDRKGKVIHTIHPEDLNHFMPAPDAIQEDILYRMLLEDGSIELPPKDEKEKKNLENNPVAGVTAEGKKAKETSAEAEADAGKPAKTGKAKDETSEAKPGK